MPVFTASTQALAIGSKPQSSAMLSCNCINRCQERFLPPFAKQRGQVTPTNTQLIQPGYSAMQLAGVAFEDGLCVGCA